MQLQFGTFSKPTHDLPNPGFEAPSHDPNTSTRSVKNLFHLFGAPNAQTLDLSHTKAYVIGVKGCIPWPRGVALFPFVQGSLGGLAIFNTHPRSSEWFHD